MIQNVFGEAPNTAREARALPKDYLGFVKSFFKIFKLLRLDSLTHWENLFCKATASDWGNL
jgi:hypothetical protein